MIYNWEFDDSVDFAPPHYRKSKYQKVEQWYVCFKKMQLNFDFSDLFL